MTVIIGVLAVLLSLLHLLALLLLLLWKQQQFPVFLWVFPDTFDSPRFPPLFSITGISIMKELSEVA